MENIKFELLFDNKQFIAPMTKLIYENWSYLKPDSYYQDLLKSFNQKVNDKYIEPIHIIAKNNEEFVGGIIIKLNELKEYPEFKYWIGSLVVSEKYQGNKIGSILTNYACDIAKKKGVKEIYLQTEYIDGGLYKKLNWEPVTETFSKGDKILIMKKNL